MIRAMRPPFHAQPCSTSVSEVLTLVSLYWALSRGVHRRITMCRESTAQVPLPRTPERDATRRDTMGPSYDV